MKMKVTTTILLLSIIIVSCNQSTEKQAEKLQEQKEVIGANTPMDNFITSLMKRYPDRGNWNNNLQQKKMEKELQNWYKDTSIFNDCLRHMELSEIRQSDDIVSGKSKIQANFKFRIHNECPNLAVKHMSNGWYNLLVGVEVNISEKMADTLKVGSLYSLSGKIDKNNEFLMNLTWGIANEVPVLGDDKLEHEYEETFFEYLRKAIKVTSINGYKL